MVIDKQNIIDALDQVAQCHWQWKLNTDIILNPNGKLEMFELTVRDETALVTNQTFKERIYVEDYPPVRDHMLEIINGNIDQFAVLYRIRLGNGNYKWIYESYEKDSDDPLTVMGSTWNVSSLISYEGSSGNYEFDLLTQLPKREKTLEIITDHVQESRKFMKQVTFAIFKVKNIEDINAHSGHASGDYILRRVADLLKEESQVVGRIGSRSFLIVFTGYPNQLVRKMCESIIQRSDQLGRAVNEEVVLTHGIREYWGEDIEHLIEEMEEVDVT